MRRNFPIFSVVCKTLINKVFVRVILYFREISYMRFLCVNRFLLSKEPSLKKYTPLPDTDTPRRERERKGERDGPGFR